MSLSHLPTYWIGGSPCSGKSSIADRITGVYGLQVYYCDDYFPAHQRQADPRLHPTLSGLAGMSWDEIWMRPVDELVEAVFMIYREEFGMLVEDWRSLAGEQPILAEGAGLLPELVAGLIEDPGKAVWIVPTPDFQVQHYSQRGFIHGILEQCREPETAFQNWMERDMRFAERVAVQAKLLGLEVIHVDGRIGIEELAGKVAGMFGLEKESR